MSKRQVWVIEGRRRGREKELWRPQVAFCSGKIEALKRHASYCQVNLRHEFRITKYVPEKPDATSAAIRYGNKRAFQPSSKS